MSWVDRIKFEMNPYQKLDPFKIEPSRLAWNRPDLEEVKEKIDQFMDDLFSESKAGMRVIGAIGSGKTWLARIIEINLKKRLENDVFTIYTKIPKIEPTFSNIYVIAIKDLINKFDLLRDLVHKKTGAINLDAWSSVFEDEDLAKGLSHICSGGKNAIIARRWLEGHRITSTELNTLDIVDPITSDYKRFEILMKLLKELSNFVVCTVLIVDELENAPLKLASALSDGLRDMLSEFDEKFGLICLFTAQSFDEWYDAGYTETLTRRIDYHILISQIEDSAIHELIREHHRLYRKKRARIGGNQLFPFTEASVSKVFSLTPMGRKYPGYIFPNLEALARLAIKRKIKLPITEEFVIENSSRLPYVSIDMLQFV